MGGLPRSVATADLNGDDVLDLITANLGTDDVSILLGESDDSFASHLCIPVGNGPFSVTIGDFDGNGEFDIATANGHSDDVSVLLGNGDGSFQAQLQFAVGDSPRSSTAGGFNGDGTTDLATANYHGCNVSVLLGKSDGHFGEPTQFRAGFNPTSVATGDFNADGAADLAFANRLNNDVWILLNTRGGITLVEDVNAAIARHAANGLPAAIKPADHVTLDHPLPRRHRLIEAGLPPGTTRRRDDGIVDLIASAGRAYQPTGPFSTDSMQERADRLLRARPGHAQNRYLAMVDQQVAGRNRRVNLLEPDEAGRSRTWRWLDRPVRGSPGYQR